MGLTMDNILWLHRKLYCGNNYGITTKRGGRLKFIFVLHQTILVCRKFALMTYHQHDDVIKWKHFRVIGHLCGEFAGYRWIPRTQGQWRGALMFSFMCASINGWEKNREVGDLRHHRAHYDVTVMSYSCERLFATKPWNQHSTMNYFSIEVTAIVVPI